MMLLYIVGFFTVPIFLVWFGHTETAKGLGCRLDSAIRSLPGPARYPIVFVGRLFLLLTGLRSGSAHHAAGQALLGIGFYVEYQIIRVVFINKNIEDSGTFAWSLINYLPIIILIPLFYHQFVIFRNFTLPHREGDMDQPPDVTKREQNPCRSLRSFYEFLIYLAFGVITGEAGYLYAIGSLSESTNSVFVHLRQMLGSPSDLRTDLKSLFVMGAALVCALILIWDVLVLLNAKVWKSKRDSVSYLVSFGKFPLLVWFFVLDALSLFIWLIVATIISPKFEHLVDANEKLALRTSFECLKFVALVYVIFSLARFSVGCKRIATADTFEEASKSPL
jgi:hypothetical protein